MTQIMDIILNLWNNNVYEKHWYFQFYVKIIYLHMLKYLYLFKKSWASKYISIIFVKHHDITQIIYIIFVNEINVNPTIAFFKILYFINALSTFKI